MLKGLTLLVPLTHFDLAVHAAGNELDDSGVELGRSCQGGDVARVDVDERETVLGVRGKRFQRYRT